MNANTIFLIIQLLLFCLLISCLIVGDTYLTYMVFNSNTYTCESFVGDTPSTTFPSITIFSTTIPSTTIPNTTFPNTTFPNTTFPSTTFPSTTFPSTTIPSTTIPSKPIITASPTTRTSQYSVCYSLSDTQLGFARFKIVAFWVLFLFMTGAALYVLAKLYNKNTIIFGILIAITLIMSIFIIVGGVFMTQYGFTGGNKTCLMPTVNAIIPQIKSTEYCYNMNDIELSFTKIAVVFGWLYSFAAIITIGLFLWEANLG